MKLSRHAARVRACPLLDRAIARRADRSTARSKLRPRSCAAEADLKVSPAAPGSMPGYIPMPRDHHHRPPSSRAAAVVGGTCRHL